MSGNSDIFRWTDLFTLGGLPTPHMGNAVLVVIRLLFAAQEHTTIGNSKEKSIPPRAIVTGDPGQ